MRGLLLASLVLATGAHLYACDDTVVGARANCAQGGVLTDCPDAERTSEAACWRLVDCGAISVRAPEDFQFDWDNCVSFIEGLEKDRERVVINCIATSTCDQLRADGSPVQPDRNDIYCLSFGRR